MINQVLILYIYHGCISYFCGGKCVGTNLIESTTGIYFKRLEKGMPPWFLSVSFTYMFSMIGNGFIYGVILSFVVHPKQYDIFSATKLVTPLGNFFFGGVVGALFFLFCSLFLHGNVSHLVVCSFIDSNLKWFYPWPSSYHLILCIPSLENMQLHIYVRNNFSSCVHTLLFFKKLHTSSFLVKFLMWEFFGWVVSVVGSSWVPILYVDFSLCDQKPLFYYFSFIEIFSC